MLAGYSNSLDRFRGILKPASLKKLVLVEAV